MSTIAKNSRHMIMTTTTTGTVISADFWGPHSAESVPKTTKKTKTLKTDCNKTLRFSLNTVHYMMSLNIRYGISLSKILDYPIYFTFKFQLNAASNLKCQYKKQNISGYEDDFAFHSWMPIFKTWAKSVSNQLLCQRY